MKKIQLTQPLYVSRYIYEQMKGTPDERIPGLSVFTAKDIADKDSDLYIEFMTRKEPLESDDDLCMGEVKDKAQARLINALADVIERFKDAVVEVYSPTQSPKPEE